MTSSSCAPRLLLIALCVAGCGVQPEGGDDLQHVKSGIVGGVTANADPAVVALTVGGQEYCTGTLIGARTVLTAAHCINVYGTQYPYYAAFGTYASAPTKRVKIIAQYKDPLYAGSSGTSHDFGVLQLETAVTDVTPIPMNNLPLSSTFVGKPIRHVGFGVTSGSGGGGGTKREVTYNVRRISPALIESGAAGKQTCSGDSGGPAFMVMPGTTFESLVGVVSFGDQECMQYGSDGRVDLVYNWINQTMGPWEGPTCSYDTKCKAGCTPVDQDCVCIADGTCNSDCADLTKDPDCPKDCVTNGVCATDACPRPDADCVSEGGPCASALQCRGRVCVSDVQHGDFKYCSSACTSGSSNTCSAGMECAPQLVCLLKQKPVVEPGGVCTAADFCSNNAICTGPNAGGTTRCVQGCSSPADCPSGSSCEGGADGQRFCRAPESVMRFNNIVLERATAEGAAAPAASCASTGLGDLSMLTVLLGGLSLIRRRRS